MARNCARACGRLAAAAIFISVGIVQVIAGIILLKSDYAYMLSGPDIWTALSNITVGALLGIASTVWKTLNKNSSKHARRRKSLAALIGSNCVLNATTAALLIVGDGNNLLAIDLEKNGIYNRKTLAKEILAYAYASSVCSPIVCIVVSIAFLTGICFRQKPKTIKTLDFKTILNEDDTQMHNWVYSSNLPKPNLEVLKTAFSSESDSSTSESDSDSTSELPVPIHLRSRSSLSDVKNSNHGSIRNSPLPYNSNTKLEDSVFPVTEKTSLFRIQRPSLNKTPMRFYDQTINSSNMSIGSSGKRPTSSMVSYRNNCIPGTPVRVGDHRALKQHNNSPNFQFNKVPSNNGRLLYSPMNQDTAKRRKMLENAEYSCLDGPSTSRQSSVENSSECDVISHDLSPETIVYSPDAHINICRTSTKDISKVQQELENLDNSAIHFDSGVTAFKEIYLDETLPEGRSSSLIKDSSIQNRSGGDMSIFVRNSNFRKKLSSNLVPAEPPVVTNSCNLYKSSNQKSTRKRRVKPYLKSKCSYNKYLQTGFSSFKGRSQVDEVDATRDPNFDEKKSMNSISEKPTEEESDDSYLPSTSAHTSGYMSASYKESDEEDINSKLNTCNSGHHPLSAQKLIADEIRERYRKRKERVSFDLNTSSSFPQDNTKDKLLKVSHQSAISHDDI